MEMDDMSQSTEGASARRRPPSMADVAKLAGVSAQTVSRVANGREAQPVRVVPVELVVRDGSGPAPR